MNLVFINYRHADTSEFASKFARSLAGKLGKSKVFLDRTGLEPGDPFPDRLRKKLNAAGVCLR